MDSVAFRFELCDLEKVAPWGSPETGWTLSWFGLTDGWYDMIIGENRLFDVPDERGVDYFVVRLWEDLIELAPRALESITPLLATRLANISAWKAWVAKAADVDERNELTSVALSWWWHRELYTGYLVGAPRLHVWREADVLRCHWDSTRGSPDGLSSGDAIVTPDVFREALIAFDRDLFAAMDVRVTSVERSWSRPEITIDIEELRREHVDRSSWLGKALQGPVHREHSWDDVVAAVVELERQIGVV